MLRLLSGILSFDLASSCLVHSLSFFPKHSSKVQRRVSSRWICLLSVLWGIVPRSGELRTQKLNSHLLRIRSLKVLPLKAGVGQYKATHAMLTASDFFLANFYPSGPFTCIFPKPLPSCFFPTGRLTSPPKSTDSSGECDRVNLQRPGTFQQRKIYIY